MSATVVIPAAGMGRRMGAERNKQYLLLAGRPILAHTLELFENSPLIGNIVVVSPEEEISLCHREVVERHGFAKVSAIVPGGAERQDSVRNGLRHLLAAGMGGDEVVLIHDGVRPLFCVELLPAVIAAARAGGCVVGVPVKDTVKEVAQGCILATPERSRLWLAQTPQAFPLKIIAEAHERALAENFAGTDDASLVERLGWPVRMVAGDYRNLKITTPEDLLLAETFLRAAQGASLC